MDIGRTPSASTAQPMLSHAPPPSSTQQHAAQPGQAPQLGVRAPQAGIPAALATLLTQDIPLMCAAQQGHVASVRALLDAGARVDRSSASGDTALIWAAVQPLFRHRADGGGREGPHGRRGPAACQER